MEEKGSQPRTCRRDQGSSTTVDSAARYGSERGASSICFSFSPPSRLPPSSIGGGQIILGHEQPLMPDLVFDHGQPSDARSGCQELFAGSVLGGDENWSTTQFFIEFGSILNHTPFLESKLNVGYVEGIQVNF